MKKCAICGVILIENNPDNRYGTEECETHLSRHHLFPKRLRKYFKDLDEVKQLFNLHKVTAEGILCYICHEEMLHNIILNEEMIKALSALLRGKNKKERIYLFHCLLKQALLGKEQN